MNKHLNILVAIGLAIIFQSCEIVEGPKKDYSAVAAGSENIVLLEEFTGHGCGNCPASHEESKNLSNTYDSNLVVISLHSGFFASDIFGPEFTADYTCDASVALDQYFGADQAGFPKGMINRREFNGKVLQEYTDWGTYVNQILNEEPKLGIDISTQFDNDTRKIQAEVELEYFKDGTSYDNIVVCITEDSLISAQKDYTANPQTIENYVHRHVLRTNLTNGTWGEKVSNTTPLTGSRMKYTYSYDLPAEWESKHIYVIAYVHNNSTKEIY